MGNNCTVFNSDLDIKNWDLSNRAGLLEQKKNFQDSFSINGGSKFSSGLRTPYKKTNISSVNFSPFSLKYNSEFNSNNINNINLICSFIKGFLFRKRYHEYIKTSLMDFENELYFNFMAKIKNQKVQEIFEEKSNNNKNNKIQQYLSTKWSDFYSKDPLKDINTKIFESKKYLKGLIMEYKDNDNYFCSEDANTLAGKAISCYRGVVDLCTNKKMGPGELVYSNGKHLIGQFYQDEFYGWNILIEENGIFYVGLFINGKLNGKGIRYQKENDHIYRGDFVNGLREGKGKDERVTSKYEGQFKGDKKCGMGEIIFNNGEKYKGQFKDNKFWGYGHYIWNDGKEYKGNYENGTFHGKGYHKWGDNEYYLGEYAYGVKEGEGEIGYKDGKKIVAKFVNGEPNGIGKFTDENGKEYTVNFNKGSLTIINEYANNNTNK